MNHLPSYRLYFGAKPDEKIRLHIEYLKGVFEISPTDLNNVHNGPLLVVDAATFFYCLFLAMIQGTFRRFKYAWIRWLS